MIARSTKPLRRSAIRKVRHKPRRGRLRDPQFLAFLHSQRRCAVHGVGGCEHYTIHHVRLCGSPRDDRRVIGLCAALHLHDAGEFSIERLGKSAWMERWNVDIEAEITRCNEDYEREVQPMA